MTDPYPVDLPTPSGLVVVVRSSRLRVPHANKWSCPTASGDAPDQDLRQLVERPDEEVVEVLEELREERPPRLHRRPQVVPVR